MLLSPTGLELASLAQLVRRQGGGGGGGGREEEVGRRRRHGGGKDIFFIFCLHYSVLYKIYICYVMWSFKNYHKYLNCLVETSVS